MSIITKAREIAKDRLRGPSDWFSVHISNFDEVVMTDDKTGKHTWVATTHPAAARFIVLSDRILEALLDVAEALKSERDNLRNCYCDCNSGCCPCGHCQDRIKLTDEALARLESVEMP